MITLPLQLEQHINHIAEVEQIPVSSWVAQKLAEIVEDYEDAKKLEMAWNEFETSGMSALSLDELNCSKIYKSH